MPSSAPACLSCPSGLVRVAACALLGASIASSANSRSPEGPAIADAPVIVPLRREVAPVRQDGKLVSFRTTYSGLVHVGRAGGTGQEFRVVFDTGSGHVILPSTTCASTACNDKRRYDVEGSKTGLSVNLDMQPVLPGQGDTLTIGFGRGEIYGALAVDTVCLGPALPHVQLRRAREDLCVFTGLVTATSLSTAPFSDFKFDGIVGLGLESLAVRSGFSFLGNLAKRRRSSGNSMPSAADFGVFLAEGDDQEESEIAFGGHNPAHLLEPLTWVPLAHPEFGYWQVEVLGIYVDDKMMELCSPGTGGCTGILDTGTSHLGLPPDDLPALDELLVRRAGQVTDCRRIEAPVLRIALRGYNLTVLPENYMRRLPVQSDANMTNVTEMECTPRLLPVKLPSAGERVLLLGEPALHRYYTAYSAKNLQAGFGLAKRRKRQPEPQDRDGVVTDEILLMQMRGTRLIARSGGHPASDVPMDSRR